MNIDPYKIFLSYSHKDEWLKDELKSHLSTHFRDARAVTWHDREIVTGENLADTIDSNLQTSDIMILLISADFIASNYCYNIEFAEAKRMRAEGAMHIVPVIARECDWKTEDLKELTATPEDGVPVNPDGGTRDRPELRDKQWTAVSKSLSRVFEKLDKKKESIAFNPEYISKRIDTLQFDHAKIERADLDDLFHEPEMAFTDSDKTRKGISDLVDLLLNDNAVVLSGDDQSGKSTTLLALQKKLCELAVPTVCIKGSEIKNIDIAKLINTKRRSQLSESPHFNSELVVLLDDVEDCPLNDTLLKQIISEVCDNYKSILVSSFGPLQSYLFIDSQIQEPISVTLEPLPHYRLYEFVENWVVAGEDAASENLDQQIKVAFETISSLILGDTFPIYPSLIVQFLRVIDSLSGADVSLTSNAACYDALVAVQLAKHNVENRRIDLVRASLGFIAFEIYRNSVNGEITFEQIAVVKKRIEDEYFENLHKLEDVLLQAKLLRQTTNGYKFRNRFLLYFFTGYHLAKIVHPQEPLIYHEVIESCLLNISKRRYANILLFCLYFNNDRDIFDKLINQTNQLFGASRYWKLDASIAPQLGVTGSKLEMLLSSTANEDEEATKKEVLAEEKSDYRSNRIAFLRNEHRGFLENQEGLAEYFLSPYSSGGLNDEAEKDDHYLSDMKRLFRLQSILASALNVRSGTFGKDIMVDTVKAIVQASGRFAHTNLFIASQFVADPETQIKNIKLEFKSEIEDALKAGQDEDDFVNALAQRYMDYFSWWSINISQGYIGRILSAANTVRVLETLHEKEELTESKGLAEKQPYNYASALGTSRIWSQSNVDTAFYEKKLSQYGSDHPLFKIYRLSLYVFSRTMPLNPKERQWLASTFNVPMTGIRYRQIDMPKKLIGKSKRKK